MNELYELCGINVSWESPLWFTQKTWGHFTKEIMNYSHTLGSPGKYIDCMFDLAVTREEIEDWILNGLGRDIKTRNESGIVVFRGFVNEIETELSGVTVKVGPVVGIANRVYCTYTPRYILPTQTAEGGQTELPAIQDTTSQARYGIWEQVIDAGDCLINPATGYNEATLAQGLYLKQFKLPENDWTVSDTGAISLKISCRGYFDWFDAYLFQDRVSTPTVVTLTAHVQAVLAANVNTSVISSSTSLIGANASLFVNKAEGYKKASDELLSVVAVGDASNNLWDMYLNDLNQLVYAAVSETPFYNVSVIEKKQTVSLMNGTAVKPWNILPGKMAFLSDWLRGMSGPPGTYGTDRRLGVVKQVRYTAPYGFSISTTKLNKFKMAMDRKGLGTY